MSAPGTGFCPVTGQILSIGFLPGQGITTPTCVTAGNRTLSDDWSNNEYQSSTDQVIVTPIQVASNSSLNHHEFILPVDNESNRVEYQILDAPEQTIRYRSAVPGINPDPNQPELDVSVSAYRVNTSSYETKRSDQDTADSMTVHNRQLLDNRVEHGHRAVQDTGYNTDVFHLTSQERRTSHSTIPLRHAAPGELSPASRLKHRGDHSLSNDSVIYPQQRCSSSRARSKNKKKSGKNSKRRHSSSSSSASSSSQSSSSSGERSEHRRHKKKKYRKSHSHKRDSHNKKRRRRNTSSSSSSSSTSHRRSPQKKRSRAQSPSRSSSSSVEEVPHRNTSPIREASPQFDGISLHPEDDQFSHEGDHQENSSLGDPSVQEDEKLQFVSLIEEIYKLLPSDKFHRKADADCKSSRPLILHRTGAIEVKNQEHISSAIGMHKGRS